MAKVERMNGREKKTKKQLTERKRDRSKVKGREGAITCWCLCSDALIVQGQICCGDNISRQGNQSTGKMQ